MAIAYNQSSAYPTGAQGESVPTDNATGSLSPDQAGLNGVYFVSDTAQNMSLHQRVYLTAGSYDIGFDSYDTYNGAQQTYDASLVATIAGVQLANFNLSSVQPGSWTTHGGKALIQTAGYYDIDFSFTSGTFPAKDVVIDRAYAVGDATGGGTAIPGVPELASWALMIGGFGLVGGALRRRATVGVTA